MPANLRIARSKARPTSYASALAEAVAHFDAAKVAVEAAQKEQDKAQREVMTILAAANIKSSTVALDDMRIRVSVVESETMSFNEASLRKALSAPVFDKLCDLKLSRQKLEVAVAEGRVDPIVVATYTTVTPRKPYVKTTTVKGSEQ